MHKSCNFRLYINRNLGICGYAPLIGLYSDTLVWVTTSCSSDFSCSVLYYYNYPFFVYIIIQEISLNQFFFYYFNLLYFIRYIMSINTLVAHLASHGDHHKSAHSKLDQVAYNTQIAHVDKVIASSADGLSMAPGETAPVADINNRDGWYFSKVGSGADKFNWYFYGAGNTFTRLDELTSISCILSVDSYTNFSSIPFFVVYTKPTGIGDHSWYKSRVVYTMNPSEKILLGEEIQAWSGVKPVQQSSRRMVEFNVKAVTGTGLGSEELWSISIHSDSASADGTKILVNQVGFDLYTGSNKIGKRLNLRH